MSEGTRGIVSVYNQWGEAFDRMTEEAPFLANSYRLYDRLLAEITRGRRFKRVLDVGCGSGLQTVFLANHADEVVGIDIAEEFIELARQRCNEKKNVSFKVADARKLPFEPGQFDCIFSYGDVLSHIVDGYDLAVSEIGRVAAPGALLSIEADTKWNFGIFYHPSELRDALRTPGKGHATRVWEGMRFKTFTYRELLSLLERNGFNLLSCHGHNILASLVPDRWLLEKGRRTLGGRLGLALGRLDLRLSGIPPFNRFGFNFVMTLRKGG
jgi:ubiquinone/menaquinone biosynthesis C-methylase UbiE